MKEFNDVVSFAMHLLVLEAAVAKSVNHGLKKAAKLIEAEAKSEIGHYQPAVGPFPAWAPLADSTEADKAQKGYPSGAPLLREGQLRESIQHEVSGLEAVVGSKSDIALYQEFGTDKIPPRPFIGPAAFKNRDKIQHILGAALVEGITGGELMPEVLGYDFKT